MGWYYDSVFSERSDRKRFIAELTKPEENDIYKRTTVAHCLRGMVLWSVVQIEQSGKKTRFIQCDLLAFGGQVSGWGNKPMEESCGPGYFSCPISYLDMAGEPDTETAREWRATVRAR